MKGSSAREHFLERRVAERDEEIARLQERVGSLSQQLHTALYESSTAPGTHAMATDVDARPSKTVTGLSPHAVQVHTAGAGSHALHLQHNNTRGVGCTAIGLRQERLGRNASIATQRVLDDLQMMNAQTRSRSMLGGSLAGSSGFANQQGPIARILDMFRAPAAHLEYLTSTLFAKDLLKLCSKCKALFEHEPRVVFLSSPAYVFGDVHGNVEDLHFFADNIWRLGMECTAGRFLFLGDYVDRGLSCLECVAYLFALKYTLPHKVYLLRGNHETRDVNGWEEHYGERSFIAQCQRRFGSDVGYRVWEACNSVFDRMPLAGVIDGDIFCVHGGIPRPTSSTTTRIQDILTVPKVAGINPPYQHEDTAYQQVASDCIWSDPATEEQELTTVHPTTGFGASLRGGGAICFGNKAVTDFLAQHNFSYILRAHEAHAEGVALSKGARVFTVFSTSKDHNQGSHALAGCILVDNEKLQVINRSPAYKNQYVHRRDSVTLASVDPEEIQKRMKLGLVTPGASGPSALGGHNALAQFQTDDEQMQEWQDLDSDDEDQAEVEVEEEEDVDDNGVTNNNGTQHRLASAKPRSSHDDFVVDKNRRSSIDLSSLSQNLHDAANTSGAASLQGLARGNGEDHGHRTHLFGEPDSKRLRSKKPSFSSILEQSHDTDADAGALPDEVLHDADL